MDLLTVLGTATGLGLAAGLRLYATVLAAGLAIRLGWIDLPARLDSLRVLADDKVLIAAGIAFLLEFFADKIPWIDSLWDAIHAVVRPVGAALIGLAVAGPVDPPTQVILFLLAGGVAFSSHSTKAGARLAVNHSPEPFSNWALSFAEDAVSLGLTWLALEHPLLMLGLVTAFLTLFAWLSPKLLRLVRVELSALAALGRKWLDWPPREPATSDLGPVAASQPEVCLRAVAGRGVQGLKNSIGYLCAGPRGVEFAARRWFRLRHRPSALPAAARFRRRLLFDELRLEIGGKPEIYLLFKDAGGRSQRLLDCLARGGCRVETQDRAWVPQAARPHPAA